MSNQLRLLPTEASSRSEGGRSESGRPEGGRPESDQPESGRPRRRRQRGPSAPVGRISTGTRRAGRRGIAEARQALRAAVTQPDGEPEGPDVGPERELRRAG